MRPHNQRHEITRKESLILLAALPLSACSASDSSMTGFGTNAGDYESIQEAVDAAPEGTTVFIPAGEYTESIDLGDKQLSLRGAGPVATVLKATGGPGLIVSRDSFARHCVIEDLTIQGSPTGSHLVEIPFGLAQCTFRNVRMIQTNGNFNAMRCVRTAPLGGLFDNHFVSLLITMPTSATMPGLFVAGPRNVASSNLFERIRTDGGGDYMIHLEATQKSYCYSNTFRSINLERCANGGVRIFGGMGNVIDGIGVFDTSIITKDVIFIGRGPGELASQGNEIRSYLRTTGRLLAGANDVHVPVGQNTGQSSIQGITSPDNIELRVGGSLDQATLQLTPPFGTRRPQRRAS